MTVKQVAAYTGSAVVAGWLIGVVALYILLVAGPDMPDV